MIDKTPTRQELVGEFINEHVLRHSGGEHGGIWNLPGLHVPLLDWLRYDWVMLAVAVALTVALANLAARRHRTVPSGFANAGEAYVVFIRDHIAIPYLGERDGRYFTSYFCSLFLFVLALNMLGLVPTCSTATSNISVTCALALMFLVLAIAMAIARRGAIGFFRAFVPHGSPPAMIPFLVPIEVISLLSRAFALMVRLFANMMAGHIVVFALLGIVAIFGAITLPLLALVVALFLFEIFVAVFQAYIFTLLSSIFMGLLLNPEH